jgi:predicted metal-dependent enzyme (double-stranded beta helix superfamily)
MAIDIPPKISETCRRWSADMDRWPHDADRVDYFRDHLPGLLLDREAVAPVVERIVEGWPWPDSRYSGIFPNEMLVYLDPARRFSLRFYFHEARSWTPVHDHNSWGVSGTPAGRLGVIHYRREDDGSVDGYARLAETERRTLTPGEVETTRPLDGGIHQTGSPDDAVNLMISVYGSPARRLFIQWFDPARNQVWPVYPPKIRKKMLAQTVLDDLGAARHREAS